MSILGDIKRFSKKKLKPTATTIRTVGGRCWTETHDKDGRTHIEKISDGALGFVGDYKPDLQVGLVLPGLIIGKYLGRVVHIVIVLASRVSFDIQTLNNHPSGHPKYFVKIFRYQ